VLQGERKQATENKTLGQFNLTDIPASPRGMPQIEVSFDLDANGILNVSAKDKATGKEQSIEIKASSGLSDEEIEQMVKEAEEFAEQDANERGKVQARNDLEAYLYNLKNSVNDALEGKLNEDDRSTLSKTIDDGLVWLEDNPSAEREEYDEKQKEVEQIANPILKRAYESGAASSSNMDDDFLGEDLDGVNDGPSVEEVD